MTPAWLSTDEVARLLALSPTAIAQLRRRGRLGVVRRVPGTHGGKSACYYPRAAVLAERRHRETRRARTGAVAIVCAHCGAVSMRWRSWVGRGRTFCDQTCRRHGRARQEERAA